MDLVIVDMGAPNTTLFKKYGPYSMWFHRALNATGQTVDPDMFPVDDVDVEDLLESDGIILSGAEESVNDDLPWRDNFDKKLSRVVDIGIPLLGVCFGHQYLCRFFGGIVERMPERPQFGHYQVSLTEVGEKDPLFAGLLNPSWFLESHYDMVTSLPATSTVLAQDEDVPVQAARHAESVWSVQFHPEMTAGIVMTVIDLAEDIPAGEKDRIKLESTNPHDGLRLLNNFLKICAERMKPQS